jgi:regulator of protease activity HflC (stomatin/prohibitin superfamily)
MIFFTVIGYLMAVIGLAMLIVRPFLNKEEKVVESTNRFNQKTAETVPAAHAVLLWFTTMRSIILLAVGLVFSQASRTIFYADEGFNYMVQYPWGGQKVVKRPGLSTKWWGRTIPFQNEIVFKYVLPNPDGSLPANSSHAKVELAQPWEFNDAIKGHIATSVIVGVNVVDDATFIQMVLKNKTENNLLYSRIVPTINSAIRNSAKLMSAQEYLVGRSSDFDYYFRDQLEHGSYRLKEEFVEDEGESIIGDTAVVRTVGSNKQPMKKVYKIMLDTNGNPIRQLGEDGATVFKLYQLTIVDAIAEKVDWEEKFDNRLDTQKQLVADVQKEKQEAEKEFYRAKKEEQAGEANKIKKQKELELIQIEETVAAETRMKSAKYKKEEEQNLLSAAEIEAKRIKAIADAESYKNQRLVSAGLTPQEKAYWSYRSDSITSANFSKMQPPSTVIMSGDGKGGGDLTNALIQAEMAKKILNKQ